MTQPFETLAAVDLGSNSFRLQIVRVMEDSFYALDSLKDTVRLGGGLTADNRLDDAIQTRALDCLAKFGERLRGFKPDRVRVVGTNTLRVAKNAAQFIEKAEALLGFPIEIIAGREEARLIYLGAAHSLPVSDERRLVIDIGGGSTEFIIGSGMKPLKTESLNLGCVTYSLRFFGDGKLTRSNFREAELAARDQVQRIAGDYQPETWQQAIGTSGTARSLRDILEMNDYSERGITREGMEKLKADLLKENHMKDVRMNGLRADRAPVLPGGLSIMLAAFEELGIEQMDVTLGALRDGVLYDLLGRQEARELRADTVNQFKRRYHVDPSQSQRVAKMAARFYLALAGEAGTDAARQLDWAARLHEIGLDISHTGYHKHSAYIVENADMPGFSNREQKDIARLILAHRGSLTKMVVQVGEDSAWHSILALRLAVLFCRSRRDVEMPRHLGLRADGKAFVLQLDTDWLDAHPLTASALKQETAEWKGIGFQLAIRDHDDKKVLS